MRSSRSWPSSTTGGRWRPMRRAPVGRVLERPRVQRLGAVRERVHRRADGLLERKIQRQARLVDDPDDPRPGAAALAPAALRRAFRTTPSTPHRRRSSARRRAGAPSPRTPPSSCRPRSRRLRATRRSASSAAAVAASTVSTGACRRTPVNRFETGTSRSARRSDVTSSGRELPSSSRSGPTSCEAPADDHDASLGRANSTNASATRDRARPAADGERDLARRLEALDARLAQRPRLELGLDRGARDEGHAVARLHRAPHGLLQPELEPYVEVAQPDAAPPQGVLDDLPDSRALLHEDQRLLAQLVERDRCVRRTGDPAGRRG